jgi:uncharacterized protein YndB with AHSA1/START domain
MRRVVAMVALIGLVAYATPLADVKHVWTGAFEVTQRVVLPGTPEEIFDAVTGDIGGWWDHSFSEDPLKFYIEPKPGGGFWEIFDEDGNGVLHATVTAADRGKLLRFVGPLGLAGNAIEMVHTYEFTALEGNRTALRVTVSAHGGMREGWAEAVDAVWQHFLNEQLKPYVEAGKHLEKK